MSQVLFSLVDTHYTSLRRVWSATRGTCPRSSVAAQVSRAFSGRGQAHARVCACAQVCVTDTARDWPRAERRHRDEARGNFHVSAHLSHSYGARAHPRTYILAWTWSPLNCRYSGR
ncbi:unnamed protein product [Arctia plantaginis]|uniref:Uncharacterized protein n=1 Tax=Arctia plantaginis TaxID=874455 RepID=A0A8S0Z4X9_ARCPL|nr:unnamed protein product [Arctia plantaginis]